MPEYNKSQENARRLRQAIRNQGKSRKDAGRPGKSIQSVTAMMKRRQHS